MIRCLVTGKLHDAPPARTSATGNTFAISKVKADDKNGAWVWVSVIAFGQEAERLLTLKQGDTVAIGGRAEIGAWSDKDWSAKHACWPYLKPSNKPAANWKRSCYPRPGPQRLAKSECGYCWACWW